MTSRSIQLLERGSPRVLTESEWVDLGLDEAEAALRGTGVLRLRTSGAYRVIEPTQFVGSISLPRRSLRVSPKWPKLFEELQGFVAKVPSKAIPDRTEATESQELASVEIGPRFVASLDEAATAGLPFAYENLDEATSLPRGRFLVRETIRGFASKGIDHRAWCRVARPKPAEGLPEVLSSAATLLRMSNLMKPRDALRLSTLMEGLLLETVPVETSGAIASAHAIVERYAEWPELCDTMRLAVQILEGEREVWHLQLQLRYGSASFCNMDRLWELAIHEGLSRSRGTGVDVAFHPYQGEKQTLFSDGGPDIDPDVVVFADGRPRLVVDAKYSDASTFVADDVYQVLAYARRLKADGAVLVYTTTGASWRMLIGNSEDGVRVEALGIDVERSSRDLVRSLRESLLGYGLKTR